MVPRRRPTDESPESRGERAQLILVAGVILATLLVSLALVLNTVIFTENLATRQTSGAVDPIQWTDSTVETTTETIRIVNRQHNTSHAAVRANLTTTLDEWTRLTKQRLSVDNALFDYQLTDTTNGSRIQQTNASRNLTAGGTNTGAENWTLVTDADNVRSFYLQPDRASLHDATVSSGDLTSVGTLRNESFTVVVQNGTDEWRLYLVENGTHTIVFSEYPAADLVGVSTTSDYCSTTESRPRVDITNQSLADEPCGALAFPDEMTGDLTVEYEHADMASGTYSLITDGTAESSNLEAAPDSPFVTDVIYGVDFQIHYETPMTSYTRTATAVPGNSLRA